MKQFEVNMRCVVTKTVIVECETEDQAPCAVIEHLALQKESLRAENAALFAEMKRLRKDAEMLGWRADPSNTIGNVQLPTHCVQKNLHSLLDAIAAAMEEEEKS